MHTLSDLITPEQIDQFHRDGYCVVSDLYTAKEISDIEAFFEEFKLNGMKVYDGVGFEEADITKNQLRAMQPHRHDSRPKGWLLNSNVASVLEELLGKPALGAQTMYYFKPPGGKGQGMHQDNFYLVAKPATCIAAWTAIDDADVENGCLWVVPGSHRGSIVCAQEGEERWLNYGDGHISKFPREEKPIPLTVPRGSTVFFGGNLIHGSGPNRTKDRFRRSFVSHYIDEASEQVSQFYHPVLNMAGEVVSRVAVASGGGPCGGDGKGAAH